MLILKQIKADDAKLLAARREELNKLKGTWKMVSLQSDGQREEPLHTELIFDGRTLIYRQDGRDDEPASFLIDPTSKPKRISFQIGDFFFPGIYTLEGDTLKVCTGRSKRPTECSSKPGSEQTLMVLCRKRP